MRFARQRGQLKEGAPISVDTTALQSQYISQHFLKRSGRMTCYRRYVKLAVASDNHSHIIVAQHSEVGPTSDCPSLPVLVRQAARRVNIGCVYADAAFDSEANHRVCREELGIPLSLIVLNWRGRKDLLPQTPYRRQMTDPDVARQMGQRWHVECVFSRLKRHLGPDLTARSVSARATECLLRVLTHNLMLLCRLLHSLFPASFSSPFLSSLSFLQSTQRGEGTFGLFG